MMTPSAPFVGPPFSVFRREGFHCGVKGCCEGKQVDSRGWHGIKSEYIVYTVRPSSERAVMLTVRTGVFPPSVTWLEESDNRPSGVDLTWFQRRGLTADNGDYDCTSSGLDAEDFYVRLQHDHGADLVPDEAVLDALLAEAGTRWPGELLAASPALARAPVPVRGGWLSSAALRFTALILAFGAMCSCAAVEPEHGAAPRPLGASWKPLQPPRAGLRCWHSYHPGHGVAYCEPDPTATFGASP